jgi:hypothetical protein
VKRSAQPMAAPVHTPAAAPDADATSAATSTEEEKKPVAAASDASPETVASAV